MVVLGVSVQMGVQEAVRVALVALAVAKRAASPVPLERPTTVREATVHLEARRTDGLTTQVPIRRSVMHRSERAWRALVALAPPLATTERWSRPMSDPSRQSAAGSAPRLPGDNVYLLASVAQPG